MLSSGASRFPDGLQGDSTAASRGAGVLLGWLLKSRVWAGEDLCIKALAELERKGDKVVLVWEPVEVPATSWLIEERL